MTQSAFRPILWGLCVVLCTVSAVAADTPYAGTEDVVIAGGLAPLARLAYIEGFPGSADFFARYCRAVIERGASPYSARSPEYLEQLQVYASVVQELFQISDNGTLTLALAGPHGDRTARVLQLFGWTQVSSGGAVRIELGETPAGALRQQVPVALGADPLATMRALAAGETVTLTIPQEHATVVAAPQWRLIAGKMPPGGFPELFARSPALARTYVGLAAMDPLAATAVVASVGIRSLVNQYSQTLWDYGRFFQIAGGHATVPGGTAAEAFWQKAAGASPANPIAFFGRLLGKDEGMLVFFYGELARADARRQRYFTKTQDDFDRTYRWFRNSKEWRWSTISAPGTYHRRVFRELPLDESGRLRFAGTRELWTNVTPGREPQLEEVHDLGALLAIADAEQKRGAAFDEPSVRLLLAHYESWEPLFPYFQSLPGLGRAEFEALAEFENSASRRPAEIRGVVLGQWHSFVKLVDLAWKAGSLDAAASARAFRSVCHALSAPDYSAQALAALRALAGGAADLNNAVPASLLRLQGQRRLAFDDVRSMLHVPPLAASIVRSPADLQCALSGLIYAALLSPDLLVVAEDPDFANRHVFWEDSKVAVLFEPTALSVSGEPPGTFFRGGFMEFEQHAATLARLGIRAGGGPSAPVLAAASRAAMPPPAVIEEIDTGTVFRTSSRLVAINATVTDGRGRHLDDLRREDFTVLDDGAPVRIVTFENQATPMSVALLLDTTGSMTVALPALKMSALRLLDELRPDDAVAVYGFSESVDELQPLTKDKDAARRAVLTARAAGRTALHDSLLRVVRELSAGSGKKAIVVFTDGIDNLSSLTMDTAIRQAKLTGAPVYAIGFGDAAHSQSLMSQLETMARATGGLAFAVRDPSAISRVFDGIARDLTHGYYISFQSTADEKHEWRKLTTVLRDSKNRQVRAREGYYPD